MRPVSATQFAVPCRVDWVALRQSEQETNMSDDLKIWYAQPAEHWCDALPVGNGRLGAMVYGGPRAERIYLSDSTFWSGEASLENNNPNGPEIVAEVRRLLLAGDIAAGNKLAEQIEGRKLNYGTNLPFGNLRLYMAHSDEGLRNYRRELDLDTAIVSCQLRPGRHHLSTRGIRQPYRRLAASSGSPATGQAAWAVRVSLDGDEQPFETHAEDAATLR